MLFAADVLDALRGLPLEMTKSNIEAMTRSAKAAGAKVMLIGMQVPPNYGADYTRRFAALFQTVAQAQKAALVPLPLTSAMRKAKRPPGSRP